MAINVNGDEGLRLENTVAVCLLKHVQYLHDTKGIEISLHYMRTKDGKEVDFALAQKCDLTYFIEVKLSDGIICFINIWFLYYFWIIFFKR